MRDGPPFPSLGGMRYTVRSSIDLETELWPIPRPPLDVLALLFAEDVHQDLATNRFSIIGSYSSIEAASFPWTEPVIIVYFAVTEGQGRVPLIFRLVDAAGQHAPVWTHALFVDFSNPRLVVEMAFYEIDVVFPEAGEYRLEMYAHGQLIRERRLYLWPVSPNGRS